MSKAAATASGQQWYRTLNATQWKTLLASNLGWVFDGFETFALILTVGVALRQLLDPSEYTQIPTYAGAIVAMTLIGWALGVMTAGILADYIGRKPHHDPSDPNVFNNDRARSAASGVASAAKFKSPATTVRTAPRQRAVPKSSTKPQYTTSRMPRPSTATRSSVGSCRSQPHRGSGGRCQPYH